MNTQVLSRHLLWKDYRQLRPAMIGCWAILAAILLLTFVRQLAAERREVIFPDAIMLVLAAPTLAAMAASGILIGHERQTRSWNWSSSLPIPWTSSLLSKSIVWLVSSMLMVGTLYLLFLMLLQLCRLQGLNGSDGPSWITTQVLVTTGIVVPVIVYICFSWAALLWNDTLTAFVGAAIVVSGVFVVTSDLLPRLILQTSWSGHANPLTQALGVVLLLLVLVFGAGFFMARAYRWRWTTGQLASVGWSQRVSAPVSTFQRRFLWQNAIWSGPAPSEFRMLLAHAISMSLWVRLMIFICTLTLCFMFGRGDGTIFIGIIAAAMLGVTVFSGDQSQAAYKFFADRGVSWRKLLVAHALPAFVLAMIPVVLVVAFELQRGLMLLGAVGAICVTIAAFGLGVFCSLCTRLPLLSVCLTVGAMIANVMAYGTVSNFYNGLLYFNEAHFQTSIPVICIVCLFLAEATVLIVATITLIRRWLVYDRVRGAYYYLSALLLALVPTHILAVGLCFLTIPNVPWKGLTEDQVRTESVAPRAVLSARGPIIFQNRLYTTDLAHVSAAIEFGKEQLRSMRSMYPADATATEADGSVTQDGISTWLKKLETELDQSPAGSTIDPATYRTSMEVENTAWLALYATQELKDVELARRAWKVNALLLNHIDYSVMEGAQAIQCRLVSALLRKHLTTEDWDLLRKGGSLADIQPEQVARGTWSNLVRMQATVQRALLRYNPDAEVYQVALGRMLFPLRWFYERQIALILQQELQSINGEPLTGQPFHSVLWQDSRSVGLLLSLEAGLPR